MEMKKNDDMELAKTVPGLGVIRRACEWVIGSYCINKAKKEAAAMFREYFSRSPKDKQIEFWEWCLREGLVDELARWFVDCLKKLPRHKWHVLIRMFFKDFPEYGWGAFFRKFMEELPEDMASAFFEEFWVALPRESLAAFFIHAERLCKELPEDKRAVFLRCVNEIRQLYERWYDVLAIFNNWMKGGKR